MADIELKPMSKEIITVSVEGTAPLIVHAWSTKAKQMMLDAQQGKKNPKPFKDPQADFEASMYRFADGGHGFPSVGFKSATVKGGGRAFGKSVKMTELRQSLIFLPDGVGTDGMQLARLSCTEPKMREDMVRVGNGVADIRYRAEYVEWSADLRISFLSTVISAESIVALIDAGGANGVGEWRPEKNGSYGTYQVVSQ